jgi:hypothetical protein
LPTTFAECNESITCFALVGILRMLLGVECGHLLELKKLASLLHNVPNDLGKIARKLVTHWWTRHGMPYCMQNCGPVLKFLLVRVISRFFLEGWFSTW